MPRVFASNNDPYDYCFNCYPITEAAAHKLHGNAGDGPDGRGDCFEYEADHPCYGGEDYTCHKCKALLTEDDNYEHLMPKGFVGES